MWNAVPSPMAPSTTTSEVRSALRHGVDRLPCGLLIERRHLRGEFGPRDLRVEARVNRGLVRMGAGCWRGGRAGIAAARGCEPSTFGRAGGVPGVGLPVLSGPAP